MKKSDAEKKFVWQIKQIGLKNYGSMYRRGELYWFFDLMDGTQRYWKDLSKESANELGISI